MKKLLLLLVLLFCLPAQGGIVVHTFTKHAGEQGGSKTEKMETFTPGLGYTNNYGYRFGVLRNSYKLPSVYIAKMFSVYPKVQVGVGAITGYYRRGLRVGKDEDGVIPLLAVEIDMTKNVSIIWFGQAVSLALKFRWVS